MKDTPLVSIIVPYYNSEKYLKRCVDSLAAQTYRNLEILLINDGSADKSAEIADALSKEDSRIRNITVPHAGVSVARNYGISIAKGTCLMFADSDDWMDRSILEQMVDLMREQQADLVTCDIERAQEMQIRKSIKPSSYEICTREEFLRLFFKIETNEWVHFPVAKLYRKDLLPQPLYPPDIRVGEDVLGTYLAIANTQKIVRLREVGYYYFSNPQGTTSRFTEKDFDLIPVWDQVVTVTQGKTPDHEYALLNRNRTNFTLLFRMITELSRKEIREHYGQEEQMLRTNLRSCEKELLHSPIVTSRKILIFVLCHFYPVAAFAGNLFVSFSRKRGSEAGVSRRRLS